MKLFKLDDGCAECHVISAGLQPDHIFGIEGVRDYYCNYTDEEMIENVKITEINENEKFDITFDEYNPIKIKHTVREWIAIYDKQMIICQSER